MSTNIEPAPAAKDDLEWRPAAAGFAAATLAGALLLLGFAAWDKTRRSHLEEAVQVTSVGDKAYFTIPAPEAAAVPILKYEGEEFFAASLKKHGVRDSRMERVAKAGIGDFWLYTPKEEVKIEHAGTFKKGEGMFLKVDEHEYLRLQPRKPGK